MCLGTQRRQRPVASVIGAPVLAPLEPALETTVSRLKDSSSASQQQQRSIASTSPSSQHQPQPNNHHHAHLIVHHSYHDHSHDRRCDYQEEHPARGGVSTPFPLKLHEMLDAVEGNGHDHIVSWQPHGRCFVVHKPREFVELLPTYFKLSKLASFQRQLNLYGFQRLTRGRDRGAYYHELFLRGRVFMAHSIQRMKVKGTGVRARANPDTEPDFWSMEWIEPLSSTEQQRLSRLPQTNVALPMTSTNYSFPSTVPVKKATTSSGGYYESRVLPSSFSTIRTTNTDYATSFLPPPPSTKPAHSQPELSSITSLQALPSSQKKMDNDDDDDIVCAFGNKTFHYLDPFQQQLPRVAAPLKAPATVASSSVPSPGSFYVTPQPYQQPQQQQQQQQEDALLSAEAESFFENFDFSPIIDATSGNSSSSSVVGINDGYGDGGIENDDVFGEMLESLIA